MPAGVVVPAHAGLECSDRAADACAVSASDDRKLSVATYLDEMRRPNLQAGCLRNEAPKRTRGAMKGDRPMTIDCSGGKPLGLDAAALVLLAASQARPRARTGRDARLAAICLRLHGAECYSAYRVPRLPCREHDRVWCQNIGLRPAPRTRGRVTPADLRGLRRASARCAGGHHWRYAEPCLTEHDGLLPQFSADGRVKSVLEILINRTTPGLFVRHRIVAQRSHAMARSLAMRRP
jgi:hypothetical protein